MRTFIQGLDHEKHIINKALDVVMANGIEIYTGYVEDPRMTDQAWIETTLVCYHDVDNTLASLPLRTGSNRYGTVKWTPTGEANVVPYHAGFLKMVRSHVVACGSINMFHQLLDKFAQPEFVANVDPSSVLQV